MSSLLSPVRILSAIALTCASVSATSGAASAASASANFTVTATVLSDCIISANNLAFGTYDPTATANTTVSATLSVTCTKGAGISVGIGPGKNATGTQRAMIDGTAGDTALNYNIYQPPSATPSAACVYTGTPTAWGDGTTATSGSVLSVGAAPSATARVYNMCGSIPAGQSVVANTAMGMYTDSAVAATINF